MYLIKRKYHIDFKHLSLSLKQVAIIFIKYILKNEIIPVSVPEAARGCHNLLGLGLPKAPISVPSRLWLKLCSVCGYDFKCLTTQQVFHAAAAATSMDRAIVF